MKKKCPLSSVFQTLSSWINAQIKLLDMWKASNIEKHPTKIKKIQGSESRTTTRAVTNGILEEQGVSTVSKCTFLNDATKAWNLAPSSLKTCKTVWSAKREIRKFVKNLPV